jgi:serine/threonine protein kinase
MFIADCQPIRPIGKGGFGETTLVERGGNRYVLKRLLPRVMNDYGQIAEDLFIQEAVHLKSLNHPQIPTLVDCGIDEAGPWLLQDYIPGENLEQMLAVRGAWSEAETVKLLRSLLPVLQTLHHHQVIHRDIKPANIIWSNQQYYLVDFGASKRLSETALRQTGTMIGSAVYAAPEQTLGKAGFASDLYSLGVTCIYLLTGISPFDLIDTGTGKFVWRDYMPRPVSAGLGLMLDQMLEPGTYRRYQSVDQVLADLNRLAGQPKTWRSVDRFGDRDQQLSRQSSTLRFRWLKWAIPCVVGILAVLIFATPVVHKILQTQENWRIIDHERQKYDSQARITALQSLNQAGESLDDIDLFYKNLYGINLKNARLERANFSKSTLTSANLSSANLRKAVFYETNLISADLSQAELTEAELFCARLRNSNLVGANLKSANLSHADLSFSRLNAYFYKANLEGADLSRVNLGAADLNGANLRDSNLQGADLRGADLSNVDLANANLGGANLMGAKLSEERLQVAILCKTTLPNGGVSDRDCQLKH